MHHQQHPQFLWSSYFNNFVTPVQRRGNFPEYVMEVCPKLPVAACKDEDWFIDLTAPLKAENVTLGRRIILHLTLLTLLYSELARLSILQRHHCSGSLAA
jgi:hypothetical protein